MTMGTKTPATRSAIFEIGAFVALASSTSSMIFEMVVSSPTRVASMIRRPCPLVVAAMTSSPGPFSTGMDSPLRADSSMALKPSITLPSTGTFSPGRRTILSPMTISSTATTISSPPRITVASDGVKSMRERMASDVRCLARASNHLPKSIKTTIMAADSK